MLSVIVSSAAQQTHRPVLRRLGGWWWSEASSPGSPPRSDLPPETAQWLCWPPLWEEHTHTNRITDAFNSLRMWIKSIFTRQLVCDWPHLGKDAESIRGDDMQAVSFLIHPSLPLFKMQYRDTPVNSQRIRFTKNITFCSNENVITQWHFEIHCFLILTYRINILLT